MKKLLILGGASVHNKVVETAKRLGLFTIVTDCLADSPAKKIADRRYMIDVKDVDGIVRMCREEGADGVIGPYLDPCQRPYFHVCHELQLPCYMDTWEQVETLTDKEKFKAACVKYGVDIIPTYSFDDPGEIEYPVIVKPCESRGSRGQTICGSYEELKKAYGRACDISDNGRAVIEKYMGCKGDFTMTYFFADGEAFLTKTSDRILDIYGTHLGNVSTGCVSPSRFTQKYINGGVHERVVSMLKKLKIKNGPVFMQGFADGDTVRFYDPGFRFPGSDYALILKHTTGIDLDEILIRFAITGEMSLSEGKIPYKAPGSTVFKDAPWRETPAQGIDSNEERGANKNELGGPLSGGGDFKERGEDQNEFGAFVSSYLIGGKSSATAFPVLRPGKIARIEGIDEIMEMPETLGMSLRHAKGDIIEATGDVNRRFGEIDVVCDSRAALGVTLDRIRKTLKVTGDNGEEMLCGIVNGSDLTGELE